MSNHSAKSLIHTSPIASKHLEVFCPDCFICFQIPISAPYGEIQEQSAQRRAIKECNEDYPVCNALAGDAKELAISKRAQHIAWAQQTSK